jgi:hypothetical protein
LDLEAATDYGAVRLEAFVWTKFIATEVKGPASNRNSVSFFPYSNNFNLGNLVVNIRN